MSDDVLSHLITKSILQSVIWFNSAIQVNHFLHHLDGRQNGWNKQLSLHRNIQLENLFVTFVWDKIFIHVGSAYISSPCDTFLHLVMLRCIHGRYLASDPEVKSLGAVKQPAICGNDRHHLRDLKHRLPWHSDLVLQHLTDARRKHWHIGDLNDVCFWYFVPP